MNNLAAYTLLVIAGSIALVGLFILGVMGVVSFFRAWQRGEPEFSSSMPQKPDRSPLNSVEARIARGVPTEEEREFMQEQVADWERTREAARRRFESRVEDVER